MQSCRAAATARSTAREPSPSRSRALAADRSALLSTASAGASARIAAAAPGGELLGRYRIERELGAGAMGLVHAAVDLDLERRVALKVLRSVAPGPSACERLLREARAMARLAHPNVVTVYDVGTTCGRGFVAMELIDGETLAGWLDAGDRPLAAILDAFLAAGRGLAAAHAAGIVHRDFKPGNVLRGRDGRIAITDFGLAREIDAAPPVVRASAAIAPRASSQAHKLTATGTLLGTPAYMAPEQWCGADVTPATDQFAYCVALWEAIAGERPFSGDRGDELCAQIARGPTASGARRIPRRIRSALRRGLDLDPTRRWPSMVALLEQLAPRRRARSGLPIARAVLFGAIALAVARRGSDAPERVCARAANSAACQAPCEIATERPAALSRTAETRPSTCAPRPASPPRPTSRRPETCSPRPSAPEGAWQLSDVSPTPRCPRSRWQTLSPAIAPCPIREGHAPQDHAALPCPRARARRSPRRGRRPRARRLAVMRGEGSGLDVEALYRSYGHSVLRRARQILANDDEAAEVLQELFTGLVARPEQFDGRSAPSTFLYAATTHACLSRLRNQRNRRRLIDEQVRPWTTDVDLRSVEAASALRGVLALLTDDEARAAVYHHLDRMSHAEVADLLGCSRRHVGNLLERVSRRLSEHQEAS